MRRVVSDNYLRTHRRSDQAKDLNMCHKELTTAIAVWPSHWPQSDARLTTHRPTATTTPPRSRRDPVASDSSPVSHPTRSSWPWRSPPRRPPKSTASSWSIRAHHRLLAAGAAAVRRQCAGRRHRRAHHRSHRRRRTPGIRPARSGTGAPRDHGRHDRHRMIEFTSHVAGDDETAGIRPRRPWQS